ncbi:MAG TPA: hypothetical protein VHA56_16065 [Mucilaginibacter sp.]|nr:hypothetical protein [Mucilaginibacter sp.]
MALKSNEQAIINLVINGQQAKTSLREVTGAVNALAAELSRAKAANDPAAIAKAKEEWARLKEVQSAMRAELFKTNEATKGFFADFKKGFSELEEIAGKITIGTLIYKGVSAGIEFIRDLFNGAVQAYDEAQRTQAQLQQVLRTTGGVAGETKEQLEEYQKTLMDQTGVDDDVIAKGEEMLLTFTNIRGKIYEQALPAIIDMTSAFNHGKVTMEGVQQIAIQVGKALNDPITGVSALRRVGVSLDEQQQEQIKTFVKNNDVMSAQSLILKELQKEFGGTAKAISDTDVGKIQAFQTAMDNLKERIGGWITAGKGVIADFFLPFVKEAGRTGTWAEKLSEDFYKQKENVEGLEKSTVPLIDRYDELTTKGNLNKKEQTELNDIIASISKTIPGAVTQWDNYGRAIGINTDKARDFIKMQKAVMQIQNRDAIESTQSMIDDMVAKQKRLQGVLAAGTTTVVTGGAGGRDNFGDVKTRKLTDDEIRQTAAEVGELQTKIDAARLGIKGLKGETLDIPSATPPAKPQGGPSAEDLAKAEAEKRAREQYLAQSEALNAKLRQFDQEQLADTLSKNEKEIQLLEDKYDKEWTDATAALTKLRQNKYANEIQKQQDKIDSLAGKKSQAVADLRVRQERDMTEAIIAFRDKMAGRLQTELEKETASINAFYDGLKKDADPNDQGQLERIDLQRQLALNDAKLRNKQRMNEEAAKLDDQYNTLTGKKLDDRLAAVNKSYDEELAALKKNFDDKLVAQEDYLKLVAKLERNRGAALEEVKKQEAEEKKKQNRDAAIQAAQTISNAVFQIGQQKRQAETDAEIADLEKKKDKELSNENLTAAQRQAINDRYAKQEAEVKLKAWKADQKAAEEQAVINGALAVAKALSQTGVLGALVIPGIIAETAAQVAIIAAQKPPQFAKGGIIDGPSHAQGGLNVVDTTTGQTVANIEGGEPWMVLSRETQRNNAALINQLLFNSMFRNGAKVNTMAIDGGIRMARQGGLFAPAGGQQPQQQGSATLSSVNAPVFDLAPIVEKLTAIEQKIQDQQVVLNYHYFKNELDKQTRLEQNSKA